MDIYDEDAPKYRKKSTKTVPRKADHKHEEAFCVYEYPDSYYTRSKGKLPTTYLSIGTYCPICGKVQRVFTTDDKYSNKTMVYHSNCPLGRVWNDEAKKEFNPATRTLPLFQIDSRWESKFVQLPKE